ncbi:extracellular solute-binding protein [Streptomyces sp. NPDC059786]|uniref:extracellular solute-binding protein n=1 Tax=Streptomyces sp. NPDC059786 TaxID=3346946 RepID=UPI003662DFE6
MGDRRVGARHVVDGDGADVGIAVGTVWPGNGNPAAVQVLQKGGCLADLSGYGFVSKIAAGDRSVTQVDGKTYIVPVTFNGIGAIYDKATLTEIGGTEPKTWDDVLACARRPRTTARSCRPSATGPRG